MGSKILDGILSDLKAIPKKLIKPYYKKWEGQPSKKSP